MGLAGTSICPCHACKMANVQKDILKHSNRIHAQPKMGTLCMHAQIMGDLSLSQYPEQGLSKLIIGGSFPITLSRAGTVQVDNWWIIPYNPYILIKFHCHTNVES